jgi:hypothetical protein
MKRIYLSFIVLCLVAIAAQAQTATPTPDPPTTAGNVWRVTYFRVKPGKMQEYMRFLREHTKPIIDEQKKQGLIVDYKYFSQPSTDGPQDWDVAQLIVYRNYAEAIDSNPDRGAKFNAISLAHYGSVEARTKANESLNNLREVLASKLAREQILNPLLK